MKKALLVVLALLGAASSHAQDLTDGPTLRESDLSLEADQRRDVNRWMDDVRGYQAWYARYRNRISRNIFGFVDERRPLPPILHWLPAKCDLRAELDPSSGGVLGEACDLLSVYRSDFTVEPRRQQTLAAQRQNEQDPHTSFWKHVHLDAGWGSLDYRAQAYGLVGVHVTLPELAKRVQIYLPPGFLLLSVPDGRGGRTLQPAATVGVSIRMFQFQFPQRKAGTAYFNLAKAYVFDHVSPTSTNTAVDLVGLSFAWGG